jgi:hypothetical protein
MNNFLVIEVEDDKWRDIVSKSLNYDFYHTKSYHQLEKGNRPVLLVSYFSDDFIAFPLIIREIPNSEYLDCTSAYGYCGPISNLDFELVSSEHIAIFQQELNGFFMESNIISAFSRVHPIISHGKLFENFGTVEDVNKTIAIDLRNTLEEQKRQFRKTIKSELNQLRRKGFEVVKAQSKEEIVAFVAIYHETMIRVSASQNYLYDHQYFYDFLDNKCFNNKLLLAKKDGVIAAGAIFTVTNSIMQYHLAGTAEEFIRDAPMKLILDEARLIGNSLGLDFLHLGGGVGGSDEDSLFYFKSGFSNFRCFYQIWQKVIDREKYNELIVEVGVDKDNSFFPKYRALDKG